MQQQEFRYIYSAKEQEEVKKIRQKYLPQEEDKLERLRRLDASAATKAARAAISMGVVGALVMGTGMSLVMSDFSQIVGLSGNMGMLAGICIGFAGIVLVALAYPVYQRTIKRERERLAPEILRLTEELMQ